MGVVECWGSRALLPVCGRHSVQGSAKLIGRASIGLEADLTVAAVAEGLVGGGAALAKSPLMPGDFLGLLGGFDRDRSFHHEGAVRGGPDAERAVFGGVVRCGQVIDRDEAKPSSRLPTQSGLSSERPQRQRVIRVSVRSVSPLLSRSSASAQGPRRSG